MSDIQLSYPTDFNIIQLDLITSSTDVKIDLIPYLLEINFFEDIFSPTISAQIVISDAISLVSNFKLNGTEFVTIAFNKFNDDPYVIRRNLRLYKISGKKLDSSLNYESHVLNLCSEEFLLAEQYRISKSVKGESISDIITTILQDYLKVGDSDTKDISIENTDGVYDFILPNKKIFETINWLSNYALPKNKNTGADMLFFENSNGYCFNSLQTLYENPSFIKYYYNPKNINNDLDTKIKNVLSFEVIDYFDVLGGISKGTFNNRLITLDPLTRGIQIKDFDYSTYVGKKTTKKLNEYPILPYYRDRHGKLINQSPDITGTGLESGTLRMAISNSQQKKKVENPDAVANDIFIERFVPNRVAQIALANYIKIRIQVPGNNELVAGMTIDFSVPETLVTETGKEENLIFSGKYIITSVRHLIKYGTPSAYITILELAKDSISVPLPSVPSNGTWSDLINGYQDNV